MSHATIDDVLSGEARWCVIEGDCLDVMAGMSDGCVDHVITDPPYSERTHKGHDASATGHKGFGRDKARRSVLGYDPWREADVAAYARIAARVCGGWIVTMTDHVLAPAVGQELQLNGRYVFAPLPFVAPGSRVRLSGDGPSSWTIWIVVGRTAKQATWGTLPGAYVAGEGWRDRCHMGGKPLRLMLEMLEHYSRPNDLILDPFCGSGTTGVAALKLGRRAILIEKDPKYAEIARQRMIDTEEEIAAEAGEIRAYTKPRQLGLLGGKKK